MYKYNIILCTVKRGDLIAQIILEKIIVAEVKECDAFPFELAEATGKKKMR
jgi:dUTPase